MMWRTYKIKDYINITRCYRCYGYGHTAKTCSSMDQLCELCGDTEHLKNECPNKNELTCLNCHRSKRKDVKHGVKSFSCPEYIRWICTEVG